ncbi:MAG: hypothetical protein AAF449_04995 [Myxococcota bacterium]
MKVRRVVALVFLLLATASTASAQVVLFPLDARGVSVVSAQEATGSMLSALQRVEKLRVIDPRTVERRLSVNLTAQARACEYDVFCLVEVGEVLEAATVLLGHIQKKEGASPYELKLVVLDVARAAIAEVLIWRLKDPSTIRAAASTAARRLFAPQDASIDVSIEPSAAQVFLYDDPQTLPSAGTWSMWSGRYRLRIEAEGYLPLERMWTVPAGESGLRIKLEPDPLYVRSVERPVEPFNKPSRRLGSGVTSLEAGAERPVAPQGSRFARPWPWVTAGVGIATVVVGSVLMITAQADYNNFANEVRFSPSRTTRSDLARLARDDANQKYQIGSGVAAGGAVVAVGGLLWLLVGGGEDAPEVSAHRETGEIQSGHLLTTAERKAAAQLARALSSPGGTP